MNKNEMLTKIGYWLLGNFNKIGFRILNSFGWQTLRDIQKKKIITSMYIWLFIVPISAKFLSLLESPAAFNVFGNNLTLDFELPFSWQALFFSAVFIVIGNIIYLLFSPELVQEHRNYRDFLDSGKGEKQLNDYMDEYTKDKKKGLERLRELAGIKNITNSTDKLREEFWNLYVYSCYTKPFVRFLSSSAYIIGFLFFVDVAYKNFIWVVQSMNYIEFKSELFFGGLIDFIINRF